MQDPFNQPTTENKSPPESERRRAILGEENLVLPSHDIPLQYLKRLASHLQQVVSSRLSIPHILQDILSEGRLLDSLIEISHAPTANRAFSTIQRAVVELPGYQKLAVDLAELFAQFSKLPGTLRDCERLEDFIFSHVEGPPTGKTRFEYISEYCQELKKSDRCSSVHQSTFLDFLTHADEVSACLRNVKMELSEGYETYAKVAKLITIPPCHERMSVLNHIFALPQCHFTDFDCAVSILCDLANDEQFTPHHWSELQKLIHSQIQRGKNVDDLLQSVAKIRELSESHSSRHICLWDEYYKIASLLAPTLIDLAAITPNAISYYRSASSPEQLHTANELFQLAYTLRDQGHSAKHHISEVADTLFSASGVGELYLSSLKYHTRIGREYSRLLRSFLDLPLAQDTFCTQALIEGATWQISNNLSLTGVFTAFADLTNAYHPSTEQWREIHTLISHLIHDEIPLTYLTSAHLQRCIKTPHPQGAYNDIASYLIKLSKISTLGEHLSGAESLDELLLLISQQGPEIQSVDVIEKLVLLTGDKCLEPLRELWELHGLPSREGWLCILENIDDHAASELSLFHLCRDVTLLSKQISSLAPTKSVLWRDCRKIIFYLNGSPRKSGTVGLPLTLLTLSFVEEFGSWNASQRRHALLLLESFSRLYATLSTPEDDSGNNDSTAFHSRDLKNHLAFCLSAIPGVLENPALSQKIALIVDNGTFSIFDEFPRILREIHAYALTLQLRDASNPELQYLASWQFASTFFTSQGIYPPESNEARAHFNSTMRIIDRAFRDYAGFGGSALSYRHPPRAKGLEPVAPMIVRFGVHSSDRTYILNSSSNESFPGKGICIEGLSTDRVFRTDPTWRELNKNSPHWQWVEPGGLFSNSYFHSFNMEELAECSFIQLRGVEIVLPPPRDKFQIDGIEYGYLFFNRHFAPFPEIALGVPVPLIRDLFGNACIPVEDYTGFDSRRTDISKVDLSYQGLKEECRRRRIPLLNLTYGSVVGSGLCNAPLPKTDPYYGWELSISGSDMLSDAWGHIHKSILQTSSFRSRATFDERIQFAKDLQQKIYSYFHHMQDYRTALRFAFSLYKMGSTFTNDLEVAEHAKHSWPVGTPFNDVESSPTANPSSLPVSATSNTHPYQYRMLEEVYRYHLGGKEQGWKNAQFPELHCPITLRPDILPTKAERLFSINTRTLEVTIQNRIVQLPKDGNGLRAEEREVWRKVILPIFATHSIGWDPTFLLPEN